MLQLRSDDGGQHLCAAAALPYRGDREEVISDPRALRALVREALAEYPFVGREVVTCMPPERLKLTLLNYKLQADLSEPETIMRQARERLEGPPEQWMMDYVPVSTRGEANGERAALLALVRREEVLSHLALLDRVGVSVRALEVGPVAIRRLIAYMHSGETYDTVLVINFGRERTFLTVISGRRLILDREVAFGEEMIISHVATTLDLAHTSARDLIYQYGLSAAVEPGAQGSDVVTPTEISRTMTEIIKPIFLELSEEVTKVLMYTASQMRGGSVDLVYLLGSIARWPGAEGLINGMLALPARALNPLAAFRHRDVQVSADNRESGAGFAIAAGCALRGQLENG
jgi:type IV pilus assembly protein PilM